MTETGWPTIVRSRISKSTILGADGLGHIFDPSNQAPGGRTSNVEAPARARSFPTFMCQGRGRPSQWDGTPAMNMDAAFGLAGHNGDASNPVPRQDRRLERFSLFLDRRPLGGMGWTTSAIFIHRFCTFLHSQHPMDTPTGRLATMGQDDGVAKAPGDPTAASTAAAAAVAPVAAPTPMSASPVMKRGGGAVLSSPAALELELQRVRKDLESSRKWATEVEQARIKAEVRFIFFCV